MFGILILFSAVFLVSVIVQGVSPANKDDMCPHGVSNSDRGKFTDDRQGEISSHNYPNPYPNDVCFTWFINGQNQDDVITISFSDFDIETGPGGVCNQDYLKIGPTEDKSDKAMCGHLGEGYIPQPFLSFRSNVWIKFRVNNNNITFRGFKLNYFIDKLRGDECSDVNEFRCNNGKCIYKSWMCNGLDECGDKSDESICPSGIHPLTTPSPNFCGEDHFVCTPTKTGKRKCFMNYRRCDKHQDCLDNSDEHNCENVVQCGGHLEGRYGHVSSPNFPHDYPIDTNCEWLIHVDFGKTIQLRSEFFELEGQDHDYVSVFDGGTENHPQIGHFSGLKSPDSVMESTANRLLIKFHSDQFRVEKGFNFTFQEKGYCYPGTQLPCGFGEDDCYLFSHRCDGIIQCQQHGGDERGCRDCAANQFRCGTKTHHCYDEKDRCNGQAMCADSADEKNCSPRQCGSHNGTFLCKNKRCIFENWRCDGTDDCHDNTDELNCVSGPSTRVITAAVIGSIVCALLLIIALGCTCKLYALRLLDNPGVARYNTPMSRLQAQFMRRRPPPTYNEAMASSRPFDEVQRNSRRSRRNRNRRTSLTTEANNTAETSNQTESETANSGNINPSYEQTESTNGGTNIASVPSQEAETETPGGRASTSIYPVNTSSEESDDSLDEFGMTQLNFTLNTGLSAQWRRLKSPLHRTTETGRWHLPPLAESLANQNTEDASHNAAAGNSGNLSSEDIGTGNTTESSAIKSLDINSKKCDTQERDTKDNESDDDCELLSLGTGNGAIDDRLTCTSENDSGVTFMQTMPMLDDTIDTIPNVLSLNKGVGLPEEIADTETKLPDADYIQIWDSCITTGNSDTTQADEDTAAGHHSRIYDHVTDTLDYDHTQDEDLPRTLDNISEASSSIHSYSASPEGPILFGSDNVPTASTDIRPPRRGRRAFLSSFLNSDSSESYEADLDNDKTPL